MTERTTWRVVRVTTGTWEQTPVGRSHSRNFAETVAAFREVFAWIVRLRRPGHTYHVWETPDD